VIREPVASVIFSFLQINRMVLCLRVAEERRQIIDAGSKTKKPG